MMSDYYIRQRCGRAVATQLAKRAADYVSDEMVETMRKLTDTQIELRRQVDDVVRKMMEGSYS
jgi:hypothetical protein